MAFEQKKFCNFIFLLQKKRALEDRELGGGPETQLKDLYPQIRSDPLATGLRLNAENYPKAKVSTKGTQQYPDS